MGVCKCHVDACGCILRGLWAVLNMPDFLRGKWEYIKLNIYALPFIMYSSLNVYYCLFLVQWRWGPKAGSPSGDWRYFTKHCILCECEVMVFIGG